VTDDLELFKACADATRLRLLALVAERELCVCELVEILDMPQGKISRHLAVLRRAGLVDDRRDGTWIHYSLRRPDSALGRRLRAYLKGEIRQRAECAADLERLRTLCDGGDSCAPREVTRPGARRTADAVA
jgi:ArsR family transcriptional regulator